MYQHVIIVTNPYMSRKTAGRESGNKNQKKTRTKITRINSMIEKLTITKKSIATRRKRQEKNLQTTSQKT